MKQSLKYSVQQQLNQKSLSTQQLNQLLALQKTKTTSANRNLPWHKVTAVASVLMLSFILSLYFTDNYYVSAQLIEQRIAEEVAENHLKLKPLEVNGNTLEGISQYFEQLAFLPLNPTLFTLSKQNLLGGRYCSIQGITALQLRMKSSNNKVQTLYQTQYDKQVFKGFPMGEKVTVYVKGMRVDMWVEKDILFALIE